MAILTHENHLHLYGCLKIEALLDVLEERMQRFPDRIHWYVSEFKKLTGQELDTNKWLHPVTGKDSLKKDFLCLGPVSFEEFQAKFNLLIALFPPNPDDLELSRRVFSHDQTLGGIKEYRTFLPFYLEESERTRYLVHLMEQALSFETSDYKPKIALSIPRDQDLARKSWLFFETFFKKHQSLAQQITGFDFCASETGHSPASKKDFFESVLKFNQTQRTRYEVLYHVGETWDDKSLHSAARWCLESAQYGVRRIGHGLAAGFYPHLLKGSVLLEDLNESLAHIYWMNQHQDLLEHHGMTAADRSWFEQQVVLQQKGSQVHWTYDDELIARTHQFQDALLDILQTLNVVIECCPTSNLRIGKMNSPQDHPLRRFLDHQIDVTISSDDPGIFGIDLAHEEQLVISFQSVTDVELKQANTKAQTLLSCILM